MAMSEIDMHVLLKQEQEKLKEQERVLKERERELREKKARIRQITSRLETLQSNIENSLVEYALTRSELDNMKVVRTSTLQSLGFPEVKRYITDVRKQLDQMINDYVENQNKQEADNQNVDENDLKNTDHEGNEIYNIESENSEEDNPQRFENYHNNDVTDTNNGQDTNVSEGFNAGQWQ